MKYDINDLEAVRSFYADKGIKIRIRYYLEGKEVSKLAASEFTVSGTDVEFVSAEQNPADMTVDELAAELSEFAPETTEDEVSDEQTETQDAEPATEETAEEPQDAAPAVGKVRKLPVTRNGATTKAELVRNEIIAHLDANSYDFEQLVTWGQETFGWNRQLAKAYITKSTARVNKMREVAE